MVEIDIDGKKISAAEGSTIIEAADAAGIYIPRFCYHKKLSIAANCRMCLIEVEKVGKPMPACATPITPDMKVMTQSPKALAAQRAVMEFLLINHPLDCPICDQGGECELQDLTMGYGRAYSYYGQAKRAVKSQDIGPLIETEMTRCIHCTRCVRFGEEIANLRELGATGRGEEVEIGTYVNHFLKSELSGNVIDLCPVGALTAKPWRYESRSWELQEHRSVAPHDCVGSNLYYHSRARALVQQRVVMRAVPRENEDINEAWLSDRDRFSTEAIYHADRIKQPLQKINGKWCEVSWQQALPEIAKRLHAITDQYGGSELAALASPNMSTESLYLLQKLWRHLGSHNIDHRFRQHDFDAQEAMPLAPSLGMTLPALENRDAILLIGSNVRFSQPLLAHRINKASQEGAHILTINPQKFPLTFPIDRRLITADLVMGLAEVVKAVAEQKQQSLGELKTVAVNKDASIIAEKLLAAEQPAIILGLLANDHPQASQLRALANQLATLLNIPLGSLTHGPNSAGAWIAGMLPHRGVAGEVINTPGLDAKRLLTTDPVKAYLLAGFEVENDCAYSASALTALQQAECVICMAAFSNDAMRDYADFILPLAPHSEYAGTYINVCGEWQSFAAVSAPHHSAKPAWKVFRVLANLLELPGFEFQNEHHVLHEIKQHYDNAATIESNFTLTPPTKLSGTYRLAPWPMYRVDPLVRRAKALQEVMHETPAAVIRVNAKTAVKFNLTAGALASAVQNQQRLSLPVAIDTSLADDVVVLPSGLAETQGFGESFAIMSLESTA